ncbi:MAG: 30S ribosomal protein S12 methylthiotransferase RimO [Planctomycetes bacterium]|nr:30S ribosomal protein S12 methylthiotransferase RimO [Planctomycetota bacterium]
MPPAPAPLGRVALLSLGCAKNLADSERLVGDLVGAGFALADRLEEADVALVNTCGFIDPAKQESVDTILSVAQRKETGRLRGLIVAGCLVERYLDDLRRDLPEVDRWLPFKDYPRIVAAARELVGLPPVRTTSAPARVLLTPAGFAYLKISEGCDQKCTFCSIPSFRGRLRSRTVEDLVADARTVAARGVGEVDLVSQDTTAYGRDLFGTPKLAELLRALTEVEGPRWWRLLYLYPSTLRDDVLDEVARNPRVAKYLDLPLQHMADPMLKAMRRGISAARQRALLDRIRERIPGVAVRTTLITGFPGETEADHRASLAAVEAGSFDRLGVFTYCREEGTPSHDMPDQVPAETAAARRDELMAAQQRVHLGRNRARVGTTVDVLVETVDPFGRSAMGRTEHDAPDVDGKVRVAPVPKGTRPGGFLSVRVTAADGYDLVAEPVAS